MTAEEMFNKLGYKKESYYNKDIYYSKMEGSTQRCIGFIHDLLGIKIIACKYVNDRNNLQVMKTMELTSEEKKAVYKQFKEMY